MFVEAVLAAVVLNITDERLAGEQHICRIEPMVHLYKLQKPQHFVSRYAWKQEKLD